MNIPKLIILIINIFFLQFCLFSQTPVVENVKFNQRTDGSLLVDIYYDVWDSYGGMIETTLQASDDNGESWILNCQSLSGDVGDSIVSGENKHIVWDFYKDNPNISGDGFRVRVSAHENLCGVHISKDLTLTSDLLCDPIIGENGLWVVEPNITIDLGGHKIWTGDPYNSNSAGIWILESHGVTIKNGIIDKGFNWGIAVDNSFNVLIENILVRNLEYDEPEFVMGIATGNAQGIIIRNCSFEFISTTHKEAIVLGGTQDFIVDSCEVISGSLGINFGGNVIPTNGEVKNCVFNNCHQSGILVQNSTYALIHNNTFTNCEVGIKTDALYLGEISGSIIQNNIFDGGFIGIQSFAGIDALIQNNNIQNFSLGITMWGNMECTSEPPWDDFFFSTGNTIEDNIVINNNLDLQHHPLALDNTWINNECETSSGEEIPPCIVLESTALEHLGEIDSEAQEISSDAELIFTGSWHCDTTGNSYKWIYIYHSESLDEEFEFWYKNGMIIKQDSVILPWLIAEENDAIPENSIDSDAVMVLAEDMGGASFRKEFELSHIELTLAQVWNVHYVSQDSILTFWIDPN